MAQAKLPTSTPTPSIDLAQRGLGYNVLVTAFKCLNPLSDVF